MSDECWIDGAQASDRRERNALLAAVKNKRLKCAIALLDEFGAEINNQVRASFVLKACCKVVF